MADIQKITVQAVFNGAAQNLYRNRKTKFSVAYINGAKMKSLYPAGGFSVVGQIGRGREEIGALQNGDGTETLYKVTKMPHSRVAGYVQVGEHEFVAVVRDTLLFWLLGILLFALLCVLLGFLLRNFAFGGEEPQTTTPAGVIDANAELGEGEVSVPEKTETKGKSIKVNGIPTMNLKAGQREQNYVFSNPEENPCYFKIEIALRDTGEVLYTSDLLPPGYSISKFSLNRALDAGTYNVVVHFYCFSFDKEQRPLNNMEIKTQITAS